MRASEKVWAFLSLSHFTMLITLLVWNFDFILSISVYSLHYIILRYMLNSAFILPLYLHINVSCVAVQQIELMSFLVDFL
jgi:hypothetical protein